MKTEGIVLGLMGVASLAGLFFDQVKDYTGGLGLVDLLDQAGLFVLRTAVAAAITFLLTLAWRYGRQALRNAKRGWRNGPNARWGRNAPAPTAPKPARLTADEKFMLMLSQRNPAPRQASGQRMNSGETPAENKIDIRW